VNSLAYRRSRRRFCPVYAVGGWDMLPAMAEIRREPFTLYDRTYHLIVLDLGRRGLRGQAEWVGRPIRATRVDVAPASSFTPEQVDAMIDAVKRRLIEVRPKWGPGMRRLGLG